MKRLIICIALVLAQFGFAQEQGTPHFDDAVKLMKLSNATVEASMKPVYAQIPEENLQEFKKEVKPVIEKMYSDLAEVAAKQYTHKEIKAMLEFYDTELGQTMLAGQEKIFQASMQIGQQFSMQLMPILQKYSGGY